MNKIVRDTIVFSGSSNTFGLGVEWEVDPVLLSEEYLSKGVNLPIPRLEKYWEYFRTYRWSNILCKKLNYKEFNAVDVLNQHIIGHESCQTIWHITDRQDQIKSILEKTKYIILELGYWRWFDEKLHGNVLNINRNLPSTPTEIENYLNSANPDPEVVNKAYKWIMNYDEHYFWEKTMSKLLSFNKTHPDIRIIILPWFTLGSGSGFTKVFDTIRKKFIENNLSFDEETFLNFKKMFFQMEKYEDINTFLDREKLKIYHKAKAFNGNYKYNLLDQHPSIEGHQKIADMLYEYILKIESNDDNLPIYKGKII